MHFKNNPSKVQLNPQFYIQLVYKAPLFITLTISNQKIVSGSVVEINAPIYMSLIYLLCFSHNNSYASFQGQIHYFAITQFTISVCKSFVLNI